LRILQAPYLLLELRVHRGVICAVYQILSLNSPKMCILLIQNYTQILLEQ
jgi:hypothetical protein